MSDDEQLNKLLTICSQSNNPAEILEGLIKLRGLQAEVKIDTTQRLNVQLEAFRNLRNLLQGTQETRLLEEVMLKHLLPDCLSFDAPGSIGVYQHREVLREWLNELSDEVRTVIRPKVIEQVLPWLDTSTSQAACWVISSIGYGDAKTIEELWRVVRNNDNEIGDTALSTITWLGVSRQGRDEVLEELHSRAAKRYTQSLFSGIARLGDVSSARIVLEQWLSKEGRSTHQVDTSLAFTALREIADANDDDSGLQDSIWEESRKLVEQVSAELYRDFDIGHVTTACNSPEVVPTLMRWHGEYSDRFQNPEWARYLALERLEKCIKPRQLEGWSRIEGQAIFDLLRKDACQNTKDDGLFASTQEKMLKESAWQTLLRAAYENLLDWFDVAVCQETGRFVQGNVMDYLACFRIDPLPETVKRWVVEEYYDPVDGDGRELVRRMAAVHMAQSSATESALKLLLEFGYTHKGNVLTDSSDAAEEVALNLMRQGNTGVIVRLAELLVHSRVDRQRLVCANVLEVVATYEKYQALLLPYIETFIPLLYDENRDPVERGLLLHMLGHLDGWLVPDSLLLDLISWAHQPDRWLGGGSLYLLAGRGVLESYPELAREQLGLEKDGIRWRLVTSEVRFEWAPYIVGALYKKNPDAYAPAVVMLLENRDWQTTTQIMHWLDAAHGGPNHESIPPAIVEALIHRVDERLSPFYGETEIFDTLERLAPDALIDHDWNKAINVGLPDMRVALANALGRIKVPGEKPGTCLAILEALAEDALYPVRRAAYRGLAKQSSGHLYRLCQTWLISSLTQLNVRAAEACGWLENIRADDGRPAFDELYEQCICHPEPKVREAIRKAKEERRRRLWARDYLGKVMSVEGRSNTEVLQAWRYGDALSQIGDDECQVSLLQHVSQKPLPPNVRHWIGRILKRLEASWKQTTQEWPDPWVDMRGSIERGEGKLILSGGKRVGVQYSVWWIPAAAPKDKHSWGGVIMASFEHFLNLEEATLEFADGRKGQIQRGGFSGNTATFRGVGYYPTQSASPSAENT